MRNHEDWEIFCAIILERSGLDLSQYARKQIEPRVLAMSKRRDCPSLEQFGLWLSLDRANVDWFVDSVNINVSEMFRDPSHWSNLESHVLPELVCGDQNLKVWSAGCSFGAEPFTLAMILDAKFRGRHQILATDLDSAAIAQAKRGEVPDSAVQNIPPDYQRTYLRSRGSGWVAHAVLHQYVKFQTGNLLADRFAEDFDLIVCRNVAIYLTEAAQHTLYERLANSLRRGGILFLGATETIANPSEFGLERVHEHFYRRVASDREAKELGIAS